MLTRELSIEERLNRVHEELRRCGRLYCSSTSNTMMHETPGVRSGGEARATSEESAAPVGWDNSWDAWHDWSKY